MATREEILIEGLIESQANVQCLRWLVVWLTGGVLFLGGVVFWLCGKL